MKLQNYNSTLAKNELSLENNSCNAIKGSEGAESKQIEGAKSRSDKNKHKGEGQVDTYTKIRT